MSVLPPSQMVAYLQAGRIDGFCAGEPWGAQAIAEGVETHAHARALLKMGCSLGQGYGIAPPMPVGEMDAWLRGRAVAG